MSREIKFRCWDKVDGMKYFDLSELHDRTVNPFHGVYDVPIMQYTGLKDKNGKEIYEGDIVEQPDYSCGAILIGGNQPRKRITVGFEIDTTDTGKKAGFNLRLGFINGLYKGEVIGNIFESPELIHGT